ncbi:MAG TPA: hypothetical protein VGC29_05900 [Flavisolibacter sp.]
MKERNEQQDSHPVRNVNEQNSNAAQRDDQAKDVHNEKRETERKQDNTAGADNAIPLSGDETIGNP